MVLKSIGATPPDLQQLLGAYQVSVVENPKEPHFLWDGDQLSFLRGGGAPKVALDFEKDITEYRRQKISAKKHLLARAVGLDKTPGLTVIDGTLGMAKDGFLLAYLGAKVIGVEQDSIPSLLVAWAILKMRQRSPQLSMKVHCGETSDFLAKIHNPSKAALYLDPMFENMKTGALPKKSMAFLRERQEGKVSDFTKVFKVSRQLGIKRIVVKRPRKGDHLFGAPSYEICGKMIRYDVYFYTED